MPDSRTERADRILDVAEDLLLRWGYRRVTIDEVAKRAGVGKGTVYLHWRTREQLFNAVGARAAAGMMDDVAAAMRADPVEAFLHNVMRRVFVLAMKRPVLRAIYTRDEETMGALVSDESRQPLESAKLVASHAYLRVLHEYGLLREDAKPEALHYPITATVFGFFAAEPFLRDDDDFDLSSKARQLAETLRYAFERTRAPRAHRLAECAAKAATVYEQLADDYRRSVYGDTDD